MKEVRDTHVVGGNPTSLLDCVGPSRLSFNLFFSTQNFPGLTFLKFFWRFCYAYHHSSSGF